MPTPWLEACRSFDEQATQCGMHAMRERESPKGKWESEADEKQQVLTLPFLGYDLPRNRIPDFLYCTSVAVPGKMLQSTGPWFYSSARSWNLFSPLCFDLCHCHLYPQGMNGSWSQTDQEWNSSFTTPLSVALVKILYSLCLSFPICKIRRLKPIPWGC